MIFPRSDPQDPMPEFFSADAWADTLEFVRDANGAVRILPPRRPPPENDSATPAGVKHDGLRIESSEEPLLCDDPEEVFEVRKIDGSVVRLTPEEPTQPKMTRRVVFFRKPQEQRPEGEGADWGRTKQFSIRWILGLSTGVAALVIVALSLLPLINRSNATGTRAVAGASAADPDEALDKKDAALENLVTRQEEAARMFRRFMTASTPADLLPLVRDWAAIEPLVRANRRAVVVSKRWAPAKNAHWEILAIDGKPLGMLTGKLPDFSDYRAYFVMDNEQLRIDWKATTGYGTATFKELETHQGNPAEIRGTLRPSGHYSPVFPETRYQSYMFIAPDDITAIWCYTPRGEPVDEALAGLFRGGVILKPSSEPRRVTLRLAHGPEASLPNQWLVGELIQKEWISP
jgi:hypothetical protein